MGEFKVIVRRDESSKITNRQDLSHDLAHQLQHIDERTLSLA
jgi:hypothetical protein